MELRANAYHIGFRLNLAMVKDFFDHEPLRQDLTFLLYRIGDAYYYFKNYGGVVFVNVAGEEEAELLEKIFKKDKHSAQFEKYVVSVNPDKPIAVDFTTIHIPVESTDFIHIIAFNLAQSVALDHYQTLTDTLMEGTTELSEHLERTGRIKLTRLKLAQYIGRTMNLKNRIAENLYIFESPPLAWNKEELSSLDEMLNRELDFKNRHLSIQHGLSIVKENLDLFKDMLHHKHSSLLEWIIILLILFEVIQVFL